ncbi:MAG: hypothetical protein Fur0012_09750 [Elusimicrobiota bacterium]
MKLNAGCGRDYLEGWINIDINPSVKADFYMPAYELNFEDGIFEEIRASHLIEHLGFFKSKYFLSEAYRTMRDGGRLLIETPHIEKTFENFLSARSPKEREIVLGWVYGSETAWQNHLYCFPLELLDSLLCSAGFSIAQKEFYDYEPLRAAVRIKAHKKSSVEKDRISALRKKALKDGKVDFSDEISMAEIERTFL